MSGDNVLTEEQIRKGIAPGAQEWTLARQYGCWYREQGEWAALVYPGDGSSGPQWNLWAWQVAQGMGGPGSVKLSCPGSRSLETAKDTADRILALREVPCQD